MDFITILTLLLMIIYLVYIVFEKMYNTRLRKDFKIVVHINGIRGKSTTTRLIDAGIRGCGIKTFSKTTGTIPTMITTDNVDEKVIRLGNANIREQLKMIRKAHKQKAEALVLECMAVNPELQKICEERIIRADVCVITNVRLDHVQDMGETLEDIALAFCGTIPTNGILVTSHGEFDSIFESKAKEKNSKVFYAEKYEGNNLETFEENIALALTVCKALNLNEKKFYEGMKHYHHDVGAFQKIKLGNTLFLNGFSINDPTSIKMVYEKMIKEDEFDSSKVTILLNSRADRPTRVLQHIAMIKELPCKKVIIFGSNIKYIYKKISDELKVNNINVEILKNIESLKKEKIVFAIGNIGGKGMKVLEYFIKNGERL